MTTPPYTEPRYQLDLALCCICSIDIEVALQILTVMGTRISKWVQREYNVASSRALKGSELLNWYPDFMWHAIHCQSTPWVGVTTYCLFTTKSRGRAAKRHGDLCELILWRAIREAPWGED